jgi:DNA-binding NarL/FixJ family response regulator
MMSLKERDRVLLAYRVHAEQFNAIATKRAGRSSVLASSDMANRAVRQKRSPGLSAREIDVLRLIASGWSNRDVGRSLFIAEETVKTHVRHIVEKLQARNRAHAVALGFQHGLITAAALD